ncbi:hypothetical protein A3A75_00060 [Candidatus Woesebacteria bacterium RIFCSPLOWO2_01_FULL_39_10]|uniref:Uncharacterized protein n=1 Tax=Candidatus Woesebacteria bacterium RIFCSPLOWO2_01_FULL_39_10 TaxID=1802516 RepID=A0A1F8B7H3_9BACT|nr:MAG: hypothetical protein A3A75_00060 [Candidatus Woesebacteria bacterium RIFCSPLOWO2_01_FULL_39_10]
MWASTEYSEVVKFGETNPYSNFLKNVRIGIKCVGIDSYLFLEDQEVTRKFGGGQIWRKRV